MTCVSGALCRPDKLLGKFSMTDNRGRSGAKLTKLPSALAANILLLFLRRPGVILRVSDVLLAGAVTYVTVSARCCSPACRGPVPVSPPSWGPAVCRFGVI